MQAEILGECHIGAFFNDHHDAIYQLTKIQYSSIRPFNSLQAHGSKVKDGGEINEILDFKKMVFNSLNLKNLNRV